MSTNIIPRFKEILQDGGYADPYLAIPDLLATIKPSEKDGVIEELLRFATPAIAGDLRRRVVRGTGMDDRPTAGTSRKVRGAQDYKDHIDEVLKTSRRGAEGYKFWGDFNREDLVYYIEYRVNLVGTINAEIDHANDVLKAIDKARVSTIGSLPRAELERLFGK